MSEIIMSTLNPETPAQFSYHWDWGEHGFCSNEERNLLLQTAQNLSRSVSFTAVQTGPAPLDRPERVSLKATIYAQEEEIVELKARGAEMYRELGAVRSDNRLLVVRDKQAKAEIEDLGLHLKAALAEVTRLERALDDATEELSLIRPLVSQPETDA